MFQALFLLPASRAKGHTSCVYVKPLGERPSSATGSPCVKPLPEKCMGADAAILGGIKSPALVSTGLSNMMMFS